MTAKELMAELAKCPPEMEVTMQVYNDDDERIYRPVTVTHDNYGDQFITIYLEEV